MGRCIWFSASLLLQHHMLVIKIRSRLLIILVKKQLLSCQYQCQLVSMCCKSLSKKSMDRSQDLQHIYANDEIGACGATENDIIMMRFLPWQRKWLQVFNFQFWNHSCYWEALKIYILKNINININFCSFFFLPDKLGGNQHYIS